MTEVLTVEGGAARLGTIDVSSRGALPTYIKEVEGGRQPRARPSRSNPTWAPSPIRPPLPYLDKGERKEGEGKEVGVLLHTFLFLLSFSFLPYRGRTSPLWAGVFPYLAH